jgi:hypothetical protein
MQPTTTSSDDPIHSAQYNTCINNKAGLDIVFNRYYMRKGLPCSNKKLVSTVLDAC